LLLVSQK